MEAFIGIDGGSTSTKAVLMDKDGNLLATAYQLSKGNPLADTQDILADLREYVENQDATLKVMGVGTTGYAKDMLKESLSADVAIVETVAHTKSALHYYEDADVIVDVGGQDIKVIVLKDGKVKDFKLNTQCSAGNGYFLQSTAAKFGYSVAEFADVAFDADRLPVFGYGCAVFMETDIVNFQQLGWEKKKSWRALPRSCPRIYGCTWWPSQTWASSAPPLSSRAAHSTTWPPSSPSTTSSSPRSPTPTYGCTSSRERAALSVLP